MTAENAFRAPTDPVPTELAEARAEASALTDRILELREAYYQRDQVIDDDATYDALIHRLEALEHAHPELQTQDSPTQTVGGRAETTLFAPVEHHKRLSHIRHMKHPVSSAINGFFLGGKHTFDLLPDRYDFFGLTASDCKFTFGGDDLKLSP